MSHFGVIIHHHDWAAWYSTRLLVNLTPKGVVFSFLFFLHHHVRALDINCYCLSMLHTSVTPHDMEIVELACKIDMVTGC